MAESALAKEPGLLGLLKKGSFRFVNNFIEPRDRMLVKDVSPVEHLAPQRTLHLADARRADVDVARGVDAKCAHARRPIQ